MAHYDCNNCGESMGIGFGHCRSCTPASYHETTRKIARHRERAEEAWNENVRAELKALSERRAAFVEAFEAETLRNLEGALHDIQMEHNWGYRHQFKRSEKTRMQHPLTGAEIHVEPGGQIPLFDTL